LLVQIHSSAKSRDRERIDVGDGNARKSRRRYLRPLEPLRQGNL
jgi:hypothetical protein